MPYRNAEALVLRAIDYSETSRIVTYLLRERGRRGAIAKGCRRKGSKLEGEIEPITRADVVFHEGRDPTALLTLHEHVTVETFRGARSEIRRLQAAAYVVDLVRESAPENEPCEELYDLTLGTLRALSAKEAVDAPFLVISHEARHLDLMGLFPSLDLCTDCGEEVRAETGGRSPRSARGAAAPASTGPLLFSPRLSGVVCAGCRPRAVAMDRSARELSPGALQALHLLGRHPERGARLRIPRAQQAELRSALDAYLAHTLEKELRLARAVGP